MDAASCCASFYEQDWVHSLLGESFHPGGPELSHRLIDSLELSNGARVLDVACGTGTTALAMTQNSDLEVIGVDFSADNVVKANLRAQQAGLQDRLQFHQGDAATLAFEDACFDAVVCECAVSTFIDKPRVAAEFRRLLRPGGQVAISDMVLNAALPERLAKAAGPWACLHDALDIPGYQRLFVDTGLLATHCDDESEALLTMALDLKRRLLVAGLGEMAQELPGLGVNIKQAQALLNEARDQVHLGHVQYFRLTFSLPPS